MKIRVFFAISFGSLFLGSVVTLAQISQFQHIVIIVQENRTPDNLFQGLCGPTRSLCPNPYNLQNVGFNSIGQMITLTPTTLGTAYDLGHGHAAFMSMCHFDPTTNQCKMNSADKTGCHPVTLCPPNPQFQFVQSSDVAPYLTMAQQYGWANYMFQTNQGPSSPAHQFIFAGTSAPSAAADQMATFVAENGIGCLAKLDARYLLISPQTAPREFTLINNPLGTTCFSLPTMASLLDTNSLTWKYYTPGASSIWTAPNAIQDICVPDSTHKLCTGTEWANNVDLVPSHVLTDIASCKLPNVSWVIPKGQNSDHSGPGFVGTGGPSWVASIVNALGSSTSCDGGSGYWNDTAIFLTWDDWGGWFDHEPPPLLSAPKQGQGDYQYGFRVPLVVISAYTPLGYVNNSRYDFGSILRYVEHNFGIPEGALHYADERATNDLTDFFDLTRAPRVFNTISAPLKATNFLNDSEPMEPPDDD